MYKKHWQKKIIPINYSIDLKMDLIEKWWVDDPLVKIFRKSKSTNSIYILFLNGKSVRLSDHLPKEAVNTHQLEINWKNTYNWDINIWDLHFILTKISDKRYKKEIKY